MKIPLRIIQQEVQNKQSIFSLWEGIKTLFSNLKILCTQKILTGGNGWYRTSSKVKKITDFSLIQTEEGLKFVETPDSAQNTVHEVALEITQEVNK